MNGVSLQEELKAIQAKSLEEIKIFSKFIFKKCFVI